MTGQRHDPEEAIRQWLAETAPDRAPVSLREALEREVSHPVGQARPWPRFGRDGLRLAGRIAAALAILAIVGTAAYVYGTSRTNRPGQGASASPTESASVSQRASDSPSAAPLVGDWYVVDPQWVDDQPGASMGSHVSPVVGLSSGGFVAFIFNPDLDETAVFHSSDGTSWANVGSLPTKDATVTDVTDTGGKVIAVGYAYDRVAKVAAAIAWTSTDLSTWSAAVLPAPVNNGAQLIKNGPQGFLVLGRELDQSTGLHFSFCMSPDGTSWHAVAGPNLPYGAAVVDLSANSDGYVVRTNSGGLIQTWHSVDGAAWTEVWTGPALSGPDLYSMGLPTIEAPDGTYLTIGLESAGTSSDYQVLWRSGDLSHWTMAGRIQSEGGAVVTAASVPGGFIGAGSCDQNVVGCENVAVWTSADALTWHRAPGTTTVLKGWQGLSLDGPVASDGTRVIVVLSDNQDGLHLLVGTERK